MLKGKKDSVSINTCIGEELFDLLEMFCAVTGQSKTVAIERAIEKYCYDTVANTDSDKSLEIIE